MSNRSLMRRLGLAAGAFVAATLAACGGGSTTVTSPPLTAAPPDITAIAPDVGGLTASTALTFTITSVTIQGKPVVNFTVTNQDGKGMTGLAPADLRFNIAKLVPSAGGGPTNWQNYINRASGGAVQGAQERVGSGYVFGTLASLGNGFYTYTFATDITDPAANPCPASCTDAAGKALNIRYEPGQTHRVTIQQANKAYPEASGIFDYVPNGGFPFFNRDIVATSTCNTCHVQLTAHGTRVDTRLCVTCHNPGSWVAGSPNVSVDFKVMIHRIHYNRAGAALPSVAAGYPYKIGSSDFSDVSFPQDVRNCVRCHDGTAASAIATPQGDNWKLEPSKAACGACHDNVYFGTAPDPTKPYQTQAHSGGAQPDDSTCAMCHAATKFPDSTQNIAVAHGFPARLKAAAAKFQYNILGVTGTAPGAKPVVTFSVTDPTNSGKPYDIKADPAFTAANGVSALTVKLGWTTTDFGNVGSGQPYGQPVSINALSAAATPGATAGTYVVTSPVAVPAGLTGTMRVLMDGHPAGNVTDPAAYADRLPAKSVFKDVAVSGSVVARRVVVDLAKCDVCHDLLSLHGANRNEEIGVCVVCHNPNATDKARRPTTGTGVDGKTEEAIDFKTMVHGIHAGQASNGGFRTKGLVVYGFGGSVNDFGSVVFPGTLSDCNTCHINGSYRLGGIWSAPTANGIGATTVTTGATPDANLRNSPTAAVCSSCHDNDVAKVHMADPLNGGSFSATQAAIAAKPENCEMCHGVGSALDVQTVHGVK